MIFGKHSRLALVANVLFVLPLLFIAACDAVKHSIGPRLPKKDAAAFLVSLGAPKELIRQVVELQVLEENQCRTLSTCADESVRYLVAKNPSLPKDVYERVMVDPSEFVRQGAAANLSINLKEALILSRDTSVRVQGALVGNPSVVPSVILELRERNTAIPLAQFAMNPRCPEKVRREIMASGDAEAKRWLEQGGVDP